jgi:hypothetical protein
MHLGTMKSASRKKSHVMYWTKAHNQPHKSIGVWGTVEGYERDLDTHTDYLLIKGHDGIVRKVCEHSVSHVCN